MVKLKIKLVKRYFYLLLVFITGLNFLSGCGREKQQTFLLKPDSSFIKLRATPRAIIGNYVQDELNKRLQFYGFSPKQIKCTLDSGYFKVVIQNWTVQNEKSKSQVAQMLTARGQVWIMETFGNYNMQVARVRIDSFLRAQPGMMQDTGLMSKLLPAKYLENDSEVAYQGPVFAYCFPSDTARLFHFLHQDTLSSFFPPYFTFFPAQTISDSIIPLVAVRTQYKDTSIAFITENFIKDVSLIPAGNGQPDQLVIELDHSGQNNFTVLTSENKGQSLAVVLDHKVLSTPEIQGIITEGKLKLVLGLPPAELRALGAIIHFGSLPLQLKLVNQ